MAKLRKFFPGGNTSKGFFSYYDYIIEKDATRIIAIKGGPGVGKSTFMHWIGEQMLNRGYDVEFHYCSSDNNSLDAVVVPAIKVALLDATAPHIIDPRFPGAVDEILHLGDFWDEEKLRAQKQEIITGTRRVSRLFKIAYCQLAEAYVIKNELDGYYEEATGFAGVNKIIHDIAQAITSKATAQFNFEPYERHLFATAFTPGGHVHHLDSILQDVEELHLIAGEAAAIGSKIVGIIADTVKRHGLNSEVYHCPLDPEEADLLVIPMLKTAVLKDIPGLNFKPQDMAGIKRIKVYNLDQYLNKDTLTEYRQEIKCCHERLHSALCRAIKYIAKAKAEHDILEAYYIPAMNFAAINAKRDEILQRILKYAEEFLSR